jgi:hypothetical protein
VDMRSHDRRLHFQLPLSGSLSEQSGNRCVCC